MPPSRLPLELHDTRVTGGDPFPSPAGARALLAYHTHHLLFSGKLAAGTV